MRKTIQVAELIDMVNSNMANSPNNNTEGRRALAGFLEDILHQTGTYVGFNYIDKNVTKPGVSFGVDFSKEPRFTKDENGKDIDNWFVDTDRTRVFYYTHPKLRK